MEDEYNKVMTKYWKAQHRHEYWFGIGAVLKQRAKVEDDRNLNWPGRIFYTLKTLTCMLLHREQSYWMRDYITAAIFDVVHEGSCGGALPGWAQSWNTLVVGTGIFSNWWYDIYPDANC